MQLTTCLLSTPWPLHSAQNSTSPTHSMQGLKSHKSTICLIPPLSVQQAVQRIRCFKDKSFVRWPPHINLLYPFLEDKQGIAFADAAAAATAAVAHIPPFKVGCTLWVLSIIAVGLKGACTLTYTSIMLLQVHLSSLSFFEHASSYTLWLDAADKSGGSRHTISTCC